MVKFDDTIMSYNGKDECNVIDATYLELFDFVSFIFEICPNFTISGQGQIIEKFGEIITVECDNNNTYKMLASEAWTTNWYPK